MRCQSSSLRLRRHHRRMTTSAVRSTSTENHGYAETTNDRKAGGDAPSGHGRSIEDAGARSSSSRAEFLRAVRPVGGSTVELARESGARRRLKNAKLRMNACVEEIDYRTARGLDKSVIRSLTQELAWVGTHENIFVLG